MHKAADIEVNLLNKIAGAFPRHPLQLNRLMQADAEIIDLAQIDFRYLVLKTDGIHEEIREKLYEDPFLIGWMCVTVSVSDLAATGADPLGILLALQFPRSYSDIWLQQFQQGVIKACNEYGISVLGGDTSFHDIVSVNSTAVGTIRDSKPLLRSGIASGDILFATHNLGAGNAFAYARFFDQSVTLQYQPLARIKESKIIREFASACIDSSDGLFPALSVLATVNQIGMNLTTSLENTLHQDALHVSTIADIPAWMLLAGPHGEYELLFTVPPAQLEPFTKACASGNWEPVLLGRIIPSEHIEFTSENVQISCPTAFIANLYAEAEFEIQSYFKLLKHQHSLWCKNFHYASR